METSQPSEISRRVLKSVFRLINVANKYKLYAKIKASAEVQPESEKFTQEPNEAQDLPLDNTPTEVEIIEAEVNEVPENKDINAQEECKVEVATSNEEYSGRISSPKKINRNSFMGPVPTADIGQTITRFSKRVKEQIQETEQHSTINNSDNRGTIIIPIKESIDEVDFEMSQFLDRKKQIAKLSLVAEPVASVSEPKKYIAVADLPPLLTKIVLSPQNQNVIRVGGDSPPPLPKRISVENRISQAISKHKSKEIEQAAPCITDSNNVAAPISLLTSNWVVEADSTKIQSEAVVAIEELAVNINSDVNQQASPVAVKEEKVKMSKLPSLQATDVFA